MKQIYKTVIISAILSLSTTAVLAAGPNLNIKPPTGSPDTKLKLDPAEQKIIFELYKTTLKPLSLERIEHDTKLLAEQKKCVILAENPEAFRMCDKKFLAARRDKTEEITTKVEAKRLELDKKYGLHKKTGSTADLFK